MKILAMVLQERGTMLRTAGQDRDNSKTVAAQEIRGTRNRPEHVAPGGSSFYWRPVSF
ncbi:MAG TPA: hypothetical protein VFY65_07350 [Longimicrobium sp.]|nr:hypothetical protein [Longimicrobium sp.]